MHFYISKLINRFIINNFFRYFFKTECEELGNQVIQEEVCNDLDIVPLFEGKIMAQVKPID